MENNTIEKVNEIVKEFDNKDNKISHVDTKDYLSIMNETIINFFDARIRNISESEELSSLVDKELKELVINKELSYDQLLRLRNAIKSDSSLASDSILSLFKTTQGTNKLLDNLVDKSKESQDKGKEFFDNLDKDDVETMAKFIQVFKYLTQDKIDSGENNENNA